MADSPETAPTPSPNALTEPFYEDRRFGGLSSRGLELREVEFFRCRFEGCLFFQCVFRRCRFEQCVFEKCDLSVMKAPETRFIDVEFQKCKMLGIDWSLAAIPATLAFAGCNVSQSTFQRLPLPKMKLVGCVAREADFTGANLTGANFVQTDLLGSRFVDTNLTGADFSHATNYAIDPTANRVRKAVFTLPEAVSLLSAFGIVLK